MKMIKNIVLVLMVFFIGTVIFVILFGTSRIEYSKSMNDRGGDSFVRWYKIKYKGDISAYDDAKIEALDDNYQDDTFYNYALIMADKYNYTPAYFDVYWMLYCKQELSNDTLYTLDSLNESERKMALNYLIKAKNKGNLDAMEYLGIYFIQGKYLKKDTSLGLQLINESKKRFLQK